MKQEHSALVSKNYDNLPREAKKTTDTTFDRIYKYFHNSKTRIQLTPEEMAIMQRWEKAWLLLCRHRTRKDVVDFVMRLFGVEKSVAYDDVRNAMMLFSDPGEDLKEAKRMIAEDAYLKGAAKAWKNGNLEMHLKYMKEYSDINKLTQDADQGTELIELVRKMKPTQVVLVASMDQLKAEADKLQEELTQDIEHTEVSDEGENNED
jgi:tRNA uridine 5-carbamoylmethylation protein Kti12